MDPSIWIAFATASLLLALAPGPDILFVVTCSAMHGRKAGFLVACGLCTGIVFHTVLAAAGVAALIAASPKILMGIKVAGALYLAWLAYSAWTAPTGSGPDERPAARLSDAALWRRGVIMNITNPKVLIFFLAFFVQFLTAGPDAWPVSAQMLVLGATFMAASFATFSTMAFLAGSVADRLRTPRVQAVTNKVSAAIFIALAVSTLLWNAS